MGGRMEPFMLEKGDGGSGSYMRWGPDTDGGFHRGGGFLGSTRARFDDWWHSLSLRERRMWKGGALVGIGVVLVVVLVSATARAPGASSGSAKDAAASPALASPPAPAPPPPLASPPPQASPPPTPSPPPSPLPSPQPAPQTAGSSPSPAPAPAPPAPATYPPPAPAPPPSVSPTGNVDLTDPICNWSGSIDLPPGIVPVHYLLNLSVVLAPDNSTDIMSNIMFDGGNLAWGSVAIRVRSERATPCVVLHNTGPDIFSVRLLKGSSVIQGKIHKDDRNDATQQVILAFDENIPATPGGVANAARIAAAAAATNSTAGADDEDDLPVIVVEFRYTLEPGLDGFYTSSFLEPQDSDPPLQHTLASTQFEAVAARKAFPCFDEPRLKARFSIALAVPELPDPITVLSNMPKVSSVPNEDGFIVHTFQTTPPMSTYLVAWVLGHMTNVTTPCATEFGTVPVTVWATPQRASMLDTALDAGCKALSAYASSFGVPYSLPKLDLVAIPAFSAGAMENWGLILYRESALLINKDADDIAQTFWIGSVVSHEISHQWFGNLVTMADWNELWLNEGFATYFENLGATAFKPEYHIYPRFFFADITVPALVADSLNTSHPLSDAAPITSLPQIDNVFDTISYEKGGAVLRMLRAYLSLRGGAGSTVTADPYGMVLRRLTAHDTGAPLPSWQSDPLLAALRSYLLTHQYQAVTYRDLWRDIAANTSQAVDSWMDSWTTSQGYPVLHVELTEAVPPGGRRSLSSNHTGASGRLLRVRQQSVLANGTCTPTLNKWWIPLSWSLPPANISAQGTIQWQEVSDCEVSVDLGATAPYVLINPGRFGFYRVNYSQALWDALTDAAKSAASIPSVDMAGLLSDAYRLNEAGLLPSIFPFMSLVDALGARGEKEYAPWSVALGKLAVIRRLLANGAASQATSADDAVKLTMCVANLDKFVANNVTAKLYEQLKWTLVPTETAETRLLRPMVVEAAGAANNVQVTTDINAFLNVLFVPNDMPSGVQSRLDSLATLLPDTVGSLYYLSVLKLGKYSDVKRIYTLATSPDSRDKLLSALSAAPAATDVTDLLQFILTDSVPVENVAGVLQRLASEGGASFTAAWQFVLGNLTSLTQRFNGPGGGGVVYSLGNALTRMTSGAVDMSLLEPVQKAAKGHEDLINTLLIDTYKAHATRNSAWLASTAPQLCAWLSK